MEQADLRRSRVEFEVDRPDDDALHDIGCPVAPSELVIGQAGRVDAGDRMLLWCEGGPSMGRATTYPPPLEIAVDGGMYVLMDDGPVEQWHYSFVASRER